MIKYINYLSLTFIKKISGYVIIGLSVILSWVLITLAIKTQNNIGNTALAGIDTFTKFFPFLMATLFAAFVITHVFKEGESDGTELIIVAKPLTRAQIITGKFITTIGFIIIYQLIMLFTYLGITSGDKIATNSQKMNWTMSLFLGGLVVQILISTIIILLASILGKVGTIVISNVFAAMIPILSFTLAPLGKGQPFSVADKAYSAVKAIDYNSINGTDNHQEIYTLKPSSVYPSAEKDVDSYISDRWYGGVAPIDIWYQWGRFYSMFIDEGTQPSVVQKWNKANIAIPNGIKTITINSQGIEEKYAFLFDGNLDLFKNVKTEAMKGYDTFVENLKANNDAILKNYESSSFSRRIQFIINPTNVDIIDSTKDDKYEYNNDLKWKFAGALMVYQRLEDEKVVLPTTSLDGTNAEFRPSLEKYNVIHIPGDLVLGVVNSPFISTNIVLGVWITLGILLIAASIFIYMRRDFK